MEIKRIKYRQHKYTGCYLNDCVIENTKIAAALEGKIHKIV